MRQISARTRLLAVMSGLAVTLGVAVALPTGARANEREVAETFLRTPEGQRLGAVVFYGVDDVVTRVRVNLHAPAGALAPGFHGIHVHANNDPSNGSGCVADPTQPATTWFVSADSHLAESGQLHGAHVGDLPPVLVTEQGRAYNLSITDRLHVADVLGKAVILHRDEDNLGNVPTGSSPTDYTPNSPEATAKTQSTGNAGDRLACGLVRSR